MSNNKPIIIFIALAATLFGAAVIWKVFNKPEEQVAIVDMPEEVAPVEEQPQEAFEIIEVEPEPQEEKKTVSFITEEERQRRHAASAKSMKFSMKYQTPESVVKAIEAYEKAGNQDMVNQLINYLTDSFPNYEIPANFGQ